MKRKPALPKTGDEMAYIRNLLTGEAASPRGNKVLLARGLAVEMGGRVVVTIPARDAFNRWERERALKGERR